MSAIQAHGLTPRRAEQLFVLDIGPLPGVSVAGITPEDGFDGTTAVLDIEDEWRSLTAAQKAAASAYLRPSRTVTNVPAGKRQGRGTAAVTPAGAARYQLTDYTEQDYLAMALQADAAEAADLHRPAFDLFEIDISNDMSKAYAETSIWDVTTLPLTHNVIAQAWPGNACHITVYAPKFAGLSTVDADAVMAHEVFHCYQQRQAGSYENALNLGSHAWVAEGEPTWVMLQLYPAAAVVGDTTASVIADIWSKYANTPTTKYCDRSYDAVGVFGHEGDVAGSQSSVWDTLLPMVSAVVGNSNGELGPGECSDISALKILMGATSDRFYSTWGASYYEDQPHSDWHMAGPGSPPSGGPSPRTVTIDNGDAQEIGLLPSFQAQLTKIEGNADVLAVVLPTGYGEVHDTGYKVEKTLGNVAPLVLCLKQGGCRCPDGSAGASEFTLPAQGPVYTGLDGGDSELAAYAAGESLSRFCKDPTPPPPPGGPPPGPGGSGGGGGDEPTPPSPQGISWGDPHLSTFDGRYYDLQAAGEFTLVRSATGDLDIQVRQVPAPGSNTVAFNQAVAARVSGHRIEISLDNGVVVAHMDGVKVNDEFVRVGAGTLQNLFDVGGGGFAVEWPDGSTLQVAEFTPYALNVQVTLAAHRRGKVQGLLGDGRHRPAEGFLTAAGHDLGPSPRPEVLYGRFAKSWRITQAASLFDYTAGQSTKTFTLTGFPRHYVTAAHLPDHAQLEAQCRAAGVTDKYLLQDCIIDHSAVPGPVVLNGYAQAQVVQTVRDNIDHNLSPFAATRPTAPTTSAPSTSTAPVPSTTTAPNPGPRTLVVSGQVNNVSESPAFTFPARRGDILWFGPPSRDRLHGFSCIDGDQIPFALVAPSGKVLNSTDIQYGMSLCGDEERFVLPETGAYKIVANPSKKATGSYSFSFEFERPDVDKGYITPGQTISGRVPDAATHVVYHLKLKGNPFVQISGPGCFLTTPPQTSGLGVATALVVNGTPDVPDGGGILDCSSQADPALALRFGAGKGPKGVLDYALIINWNNWGPGNYHFTVRTCSAAQVKFTKTGRSCPSP